MTNGAFGKTKFNDDGKNPGDVWGDIKQLTYKSKELVSRDVLNTIQKPFTDEELSAVRDSAKSGCPFGDLSELPHSIPAGNCEIPIAVP